MSTSFLYHAIGVRDYQYVRTRYVGGEVVFVIEPKRKTRRCTACGSSNVWRHGVVVRRFRALPVGSKPVSLEARIPRLACQQCGVVRQVAVAFAEPRRTYTKPFGRYVLELSQYMTIKDVACHLGVSWDVVKEIQKKYLKRRFDKPRLKHVKQIAIDEISTG